jgi:hypothetical protein
MALSCVEAYDASYSQLNNTRDLVVYTPPSYFENTLKARKC